MSTNELPTELTGSAHRLAKAARDGELSAREILQHYLARVEHLDSKVRAFLHVNGGRALEQASALDQRKPAERSGALYAVPVAIKDNLCTRGIPTTCGSKILAGYQPVYNATVVERIEREGGIVLGKTNMDEFAMGASTENSGYFPTCNPHDVERVPGGSSGGSAAAVAAGFAPLALGSDTGGSVRQPASFCGLVGLRPTYGMISRFGLVAFASSLDQVGPLALNCADTRLLFDVIAGPDPRDSTCRDKPLDAYRTQGSIRTQGLRVGIPREYDSDAIDAPVRSALARCRRALEERGARMISLDLPLTEFAIPTYYLVVTSEASSNLARFDGVRYGPRAAAGDLLETYLETRGQGFGDEVKRRIMLGTYALSAGYYDAYYKKALQVRQKLVAEFQGAFAEVDVILGPTAPTAAFRIGEKSADPLQLYLCDVFTAPSALAGIPGLSVPVGSTKEGLPIGAQLLGPAGSEYRLFAVAEEIERLLDSAGKPVEPKRGK